MGQSTDAIFGYGWCGEEECDFDGEYKEGSPDIYDASAELETKFKVTIGSHCSLSCRMPYIVVMSTHVVANRGYPQTIVIDRDYDDVAMERRLEEAIAYLRKKHPRICERLSVPEKPEFRWFLCSDWED